MRLAAGPQPEAAAGHLLEARGQVELGLAVDLVGQIIPVVALDGGQRGEALDLGDQRRRGRLRLAGRGLGPALQLGGVHGHDHRGVEAGLLDEQPDHDQAQHG